MIIGMALNKQMRRAYRDGAVVRQSHFDELIAAVTEGSSRCSVCKLHHPKRLVTQGICSSCRQALGKSEARRLARRASRSEPPELGYELPCVITDNVVYVDASWHEGVAGVAIVGALGAYTDRVPAPSSGAAEVFAMQWALKIAKEQQRQGLVFRTDNQSAERFGKNAVPKQYDWVVEWIPRRKNQRADRAASNARLAP